MLSLYQKDQSILTPIVKPYSNFGALIFNDEDLKQAMTTWLKMFVAKEYNIGIEKLVPRYN